MENQWFSVIWTPRLVHFIDLSITSPFQLCNHLYAKSLDWVWVSPMRSVHRRGVVGLDQLP